METDEILELMGQISNNNYILSTSSGSTGYFIAPPGPSIIIQDSRAVVDQISRLINSLSDSKNTNQQQAVKHLTYAKAFLEKMLLDKINEKTNGDSKPN